MPVPDSGIGKHTSSRKIHRRLLEADDDLVDDVNEKLSIFIEEGRLVPFHGDHQFARYTTPYFPIRGRKRARPIFPFCKLNHDLNFMLKDVKFRQTSLSTIIDGMRSSSNIFLADVKDAFQQISLGPNLQRLCTLWYKNRLWSFTRLPYGAFMSPYVLEQVMAFLRDKYHTDIDPTTPIFSYMDDFTVCTTNITPLQQLCATYSFPITFDNIYDNATTPMLGTVIVDYGANISINPSLWQKICNPDINVSTFTFRDCLSLLGKIPNTPEFLPPGIYPAKNLLQSFTARTKSQTNSTWDDLIPPQLMTLMTDFIDKCKSTTIPTISRLVDWEQPITIYCDASNDLSANKIFQNGHVIFSTQKPFNKSSAKLHINCKEMIAVFEALCRIILYEQHCNKQFKSLSVITDSSTVYSILRNERTKASLMQPFQNKYLGYCQSLLGPRYRDIDWILVKGEENFADDLTRDPLVHKLVCLRDKIPMTSSDDIFQANSTNGMGFIGMDQPSTSIPSRKRLAEQTVSIISKKRKMTTDDTDYMNLPITTLLLEMLSINDGDINNLTQSGILHSKDGLYFHGDQLYVPEILRHRIIKDYHEHYAHPGSEVLQHLIEQVFWWPNLSNTLALFTANCTGCILGKSYHNYAPRGKLPQPTKPFNFICIDYCGPYVSETEADNNPRYAFTILDLATNYYEAFATYNKSTEEALHCLQTYCYRYNFPQFILSDNDAAFSTIFDSWLEQHHITHYRTPIYSPQSNGKLERYHRTMNDGLRCSLSLNEAGPKMWYTYLDQVVSRMNIAFHKDYPNAYSQVFKHPKNLLYSYLTHPPQDSPQTADFLGRFHSGDIVMKKVISPTKLQPRYDGLYEILEKTAPYTYSIRSLGAPPTSPPTTIREDSIKLVPLLPTLEHF